MERMVCFTKDDNCCFWYSRVKVRNCGEFVVYKFGQFPTLQHFCSLRYCGAGYTGNLKMVSLSRTVIICCLICNRAKNVIAYV